MTENSFYKIVRLKAENIKALTAVEIVPGDRSVVKISGRNGAGKSSILDAIWWALAGQKNVQDRPIRNGEKRAEIRLDLGDLRVRRSFTAAGGTSLFVENAEGARYPSPQAVLDKLVGELTFDPLLFIRQDRKAQYETLRRVADVGDEIDNLDAWRSEKYDERRELNRRAAALKAQASSITLPADCPHEEEPASALAAEMERIQACNANHKAERDKLLTMNARLRNYKASIEQKKNEMAQLRAALASAEEKYKQALEGVDKASREAEEQQALCDNLVDIDSAEVSRKIKAASDRNALARRWKEAQKLLSDKQEAERLADECDNAIRSIDSQKSQIMAAAKLPIEGLSLGDGVVLYNGLPIEQVSSAEQLRVSLAIAMALNPRLRVIRITDGSLLDSASMAEVDRLARERDYQVWIEVVDESERVGIVIRDGSVAAVDGVPVADGLEAGHDE